MLEEQSLSFISASLTVRLTGEPPFNGVIIGETRDGHAWHIVKDGTKFSCGIHKSFCRPEESH